MAKVNWNQIGQTPSATAPSGNSDTKESKFLKLADHGDKAHVRFLINTLEEIEIYTTHRAHVKTSMGKEWDLTVECLRSSGDQPVDACPFCEAGLKPKTELYMQLYDVDNNALKIWTRPTSFAERLRAAFAAVANMSGGKPICSAIFEITRIGAKGSKQTEYTIYPVSIDNVTLDQIPVKPIDVHTSGCLRAVDWNGARYWQQHGDFPQPEKTAVDAYGRPIDANPAPQAQVSYHAPQPAPQVPPMPAPTPVPQPGPSGTAYQPAPQPIAQPYPQPAPQPMPQPAPQPIAQPVPQPQPQATPYVAPQAPNGLQVDENGVVQDAPATRGGRRVRF